MSMLQNLLGPMLEEIQTEATALKTRFPADFVVGAAASLALKHLLKRAQDAGVPDSFPQKYNLTPEQAKKIYDDVLASALTRI